MLDFPSSPIAGQQFTAAGVTWTFDGVKWLPSGLSPLVVPGINDNRIINGDMRIDQRNNGASGTAAGVYTLDRWQYVASQTSKGTWKQATVNQAGFPYAHSFITSSAYASLAGDYFTFQQSVEADMVSDFQWGTASAQPVTLSFWAYSTLAGTFSGAIINYANTRSYPFSFSLPTASTWAKIAVTIPGDTGGTWVMSGNGGAMNVRFDLGSGANSRGSAGAWVNANLIGVTGSVSIVATNAAQFFLTGVKLEVGSVATPFNRQSLAKSMADCQRYYQQIVALQLAGLAPTSGGNVTCNAVPLGIQMRASPTITQSGSTFGGCTGVNLFAASPNVVQGYFTGCVPNANMYALITVLADAEL